MPRKDKTFKDIDVLRFYCRNLDPSEKYLVLRAFNNYLAKGEKICDDDPDEKTDPCEWIEFSRELVKACSDKAKLLSKVVVVLATLEVALGALSWAGPAAKVLKIVQAVLAYLESILIFVTALLLMIEQLEPFLIFLDAFFCKGEKPLPLDRPPNLELPDDPQRRIDDIMEWLEGIWGWLSTSDSDNLPPDVLTGP